MTSRYPEELWTAIVSHKKGVLSHPDSRYRPLRLLALAALGLAFLGARALALSPWLTIPMGVLATVGVPGWFLANWRLGTRDHDLIYRLAVAALWGLGFALTVAVLSATMSLPVSWGVAGAVVGGIAFAERSERRRRGETRPTESARPHSQKLWQRAAMVVVVAGTLASGMWGPPLDATKDTIDHVAFVREIVNTNQSFPTTSFYQDPGTNGRDIRKAYLHTVYAWWMPANPASVPYGAKPWAAVATLLWLLLAYGAAYRTTRCSGTSALTLIIFVAVLAGGLTTPTLRGALFPNRLGIPLLVWLGVHGLHLLKLLPQADDVWAAPRWWELGALAALASAIHVQFGVLAGFVALTVVLTGLVSRPRVRPSLMAATVAIVAGATMPIVLLRYLTAPHASDLHRRLQDVVFVGNGFVVNPLRILSEWHVVGLFAALTTVVWWWRRRGDTPAIIRYGAITATLVVFVQFNPLVLPLAYDAISYISFRLSLAWPAALISAIILRSLPSLPSVVPARRAWTVVFVALLMTAGARSVQTDVAVAQRTTDEHERSYRTWQNAVDWINANLADTTVVAADPITAYALSAVTRLEVLCTLDQHAPTNDSQVETRLELARQIVWPSTPPSARTRAIAASSRFGGVDAIVINARTPDDIVPEAWPWSTELALMSREALIAGGFRELATIDGVSIFSVTSSAADAAPVFASLNEFQGDQVLDATAGTAILHSVRLNKTVAKRGEMLQVRSVWSQNPDNSYSDLLSLRLDHASPSLVVPAQPFPKLSRKLTERVKRELYRYRVDQRFDATEFANKKFLGDELSFTVPTNLAPGEYELRLLRHRKSSIPNHQLRDFFYDDDSYHGTLAATLVVE